MCTVPMTVADPVLTFKKVTNLLRTDTGALSIRTDVVNGRDVPKVFAGY